MQSIGADVQAFLGCCQTHQVLLLSQSEASVALRMKHPLLLGVLLQQLAHFQVQSSCQIEHVTSQSMSMLSQSCSCLIVIYNNINNHEHSFNVAVNRYKSGVSLDPD